MFSLASSSHPHPSVTQKVAQPLPPVFWLTYGVFLMGQLSDGPGPGAALQAPQRVSHCSPAWVNVLLQACHGSTWRLALW